MATKNLCPGMKVTIRHDREWREGVIDQVAMIDGEERIRGHWVRREYWSEVTFDVTRDDVKI